MGDTMSDEVAKLKFRDHELDLPLLVGTENEVSLDISQLRAKTGAITLDTGFVNTGSCKSHITFIDGEKGVLQYRGYPIEQLAEQSTFVEVAYLLIFGELPNAEQLTHFREMFSNNQYIHEAMRHHFEGFPDTAPPMAILSAMINASGCYQPNMLDSDIPFEQEAFQLPAARLMSKVRTIVAAAYKTSLGESMIFPRPDLPYVENFLHMMFSRPNKPYEATPEIARALDQLLILHGDHEQNCSTSTVRMVGSSQANLFASVAAGVCALWGPLHGGANRRVIEMLSTIHESGQTIDSLIAGVKDKTHNQLLMGFGHRVYKTFDPRAKIIKKSCDDVLDRHGRHDPLLDLARELEEKALKDEYFIERNLYPNVDFYSGILLRAIGIPISMFTVIFAIGRMPGWIAQWRETRLDPDARIYRPRQLYIGETERAYVPLEERV